ncbi:MAG: amidase [Pirellulaceae bacterium]|nr:amidase [Pirellulaceae bacterium]
MNDKPLLDIHDDELTTDLPTKTPLVDRRKLLTWLGAAGVGTIVFQKALAAQVEDTGKVTVEMVAQAEWIAGIELSETQRAETATGLQNLMRELDALRDVDVGYDTWPALSFRVKPSAKPLPLHPLAVRSDPKNELATPDIDVDLAYMSIAQQSRLIRSGQISSLELTQMYLRRLKKFDPTLKFYVNLTEELALEQAAAVDRTRNRLGEWHPLRGIPWGAKDLIAYPKYPTTWGAPQFKDRILNTKATVAAKLDQVGAVLVAKLALGALAMGDKWYGGPTKNPWNPAQGSSGSSAGSASATAAGCVGFSLGSETLGSIMSPSRRCGVTGLRPTFGRVSRQGCMSLSWSMDKLGPICRSAEDCALVFQAIHGGDGLDPSAVDRPFHWPVKVNMKRIKVGYVDDGSKLADREALQVFKDRGCKLVEIQLPGELPTWPLTNILFAEAAAQFDPLTRAGVEEGLNAWPSLFRRAEFLPAVEYLRALRIRSKLQDEMQQVMQQVDVFVDGGRDEALITNMTGHPAIAMPSGFVERAGVRQPVSVQLTGRLYDETTILALAQLFQSETDYHRQRPPQENSEV